MNNIIIITISLFFILLGIIIFVSRKSIVKYIAIIETILLVPTFALAFVVFSHGVIQLLWVLPTLLLIVLFNLWLFNFFVIRDFDRINYNLKIISRGKSNIEKHRKLLINKNELGTAARSIQKIRNNYIAYCKHITEISNNNLTTNKSNIKQNSELGLALQKMNNELSKISKENELQQNLEQQRNWSSSGLAQFNEIVRKRNENYNFAIEALTFIIKYLEANQGGVFLLTEEEKKSHLEMIACYAYDRQKYVTKKIEIGEGLIGACYLEKETIFMTELPNQYVEITSGLGKATAKSLIIIPLKIEQNIIGVLEIASMKVFQEHQIKLAEDLSNIFAATLFSVKNSIATNKLLHQSKEQAEVLSSQEEELRQNLEELTATQEEMKRKNNELEAANNEMKNKEKELENSLKLVKDNEKELNDKNQNMLAQEEELRQNLEELQSIQEEMTRKQQELHDTNIKMKENEILLKENMEKIAKQEKEIREQKEKEKARMDEMRANMQKQMKQYMQKTKEKEQKLLDKIEQLSK